MEYTVEQIKNAYDNLPYNVIDAMDQIDLGAQITAIAQKFNLHIDKQNELYSEIMLVIIGLKSTVDFENTIFEKLSLPEDQQTAFTDDINEKIFLAMRQEMQDSDEVEELLNEKDSEVIIPAITQNPVHNEIDLDLDNDEPAATPINLPIAKKVDLAIVEQHEELPAPKNTQPAPSITEQKLSAVFSVPKTTTDHSVPNITKETRSVADPYREAIE